MIGRLSCALLVAILALVACDGEYQLTEDERLKSEVGARDFAEGVGATFVSCSGTDSDGDSYVTCTIDEGGVQQKLLCSFKSRGCKSKEVLLHRRFTA